MSNQPVRIPNFKRLLITGAVLGLIAGVVVSYLGDDVQGYSESTASMYLGAMGAVLGTGLAGLLGILLDRSGRSDS